MSTNTVVFSIVACSLTLSLAACETGVIDPGDGGAFTDSSTLASLPQQRSQPAAVPTPDGRLLLSGSIRMLADGQGAWILAGVTARNVTAATVAGQNLCFVQLRAAASAGAPARTWAVPVQPATECAPTTSDILGGATSSVTARDIPLTRVSAVVGAAPGGNFVLEALVRYGSDTVVVPLGTRFLSSSGALPRDPRVLSFAAASEVVGVAPRELLTRIVATNETNQAVHLEFGACSVIVHAYRNRERTGQPVWRSDQRRLACPAIGYSVVAIPGDAMPFDLRVPLYEVLGDSLADGRYYFTAAVFLSGERISLPAGAAYLTSQIDPLPNVRELDGVRYETETITDTATGAVTLRLKVTNTTAIATLIRRSGSVTCESQLYGFTTAAQRDVWYLRQSADWFYRGCSLEIPPMTLAAGETKVISSVLPAGTSRTLYYLVLVLWIDHPANGIARIVLSGGDAEFQ
jgi:hypothetical protein